MIKQMRNKNIFQLYIKFKNVCVISIYILTQLNTVYIKFQCYTYSSPTCMYLKNLCVHIHICTYLQVGKGTIVQ